jgi:hypothetical protein
VQLAYVGCLSVPVYWFAFICLSYRWNAHHLLYTILHKYVDVVDSEDVKAGYERSEGSAHLDVWAWMAAVAAVNGLYLRSNDTLLFSALPLAFSVYLLACNLVELRAAIPVLDRVQQERRRMKEAAVAAIAAIQPQQHKGAASASRSAST